MNKHYFTFLWMALCTVSIVSAQYKVALWPNFTSAVVSYTFDDGCSGQFKSAVPLLDKYGFPGTFFTVTTWSPNWENLKAMAASGHEIASHTLTHPSLTGDKIKAEKEMAESKRIIEEQIGDSCLTIAYPYCSTPDLATCARYYGSGRICNGQIIPSSPENYYLLSSFVCGTMGQNKTTQNLIELYGRTLEQKGWCVLLFHGVDDDGGYSPIASSVLDETLAYLKAHSDDYWVSTFRDATLYAKERDAVVVTELKSGRKQLTLNLSDNLNDALYNYPLTLSCPLPKGWKNATVAQAGKALNSSVKAGTLFFNAVPDAGMVTISKK